MRLALRGALGFLQARCLPGVVVFVFTLSSVSFSQNEVQENPASSLRGTVINSVTREPVGRALVFSQDNRFAMMTDADGHFEFTLPQAAVGSVSSFPSVLSARKPGFLSDPAPDPQNLQPGKELTILLIPEALIVGHVTLPTSETSQPIEVQLLRRQVQEGRATWVTQAMATTRSDGEFRFADLVAGTYKLLTQESLDRDPEVFGRNAQLFGYPPLFYPSAMDFSGAAPIQLSAGMTFQADFSLLRREYYQVKVPVVTPQPGAPVNVEVSVQGHDGPGYSLGYSQRDQAITGMLPNGHYTLEVFTYGQPSASGVVNITVNGAGYEGPRVTLVPDRSIAVNVKEEFTSATGAVQIASLGEGVRRLGAPGPGGYLSVMLEPADEFFWSRGGNRASRVVPEDKSIVIDNVPPGRYWVRIFSGTVFAASVTAGGADLLQHPLIVGLGGASPPIEVTMRDEKAQIDGTIEGAENNPGSAGVAQNSPGSYVPFAFVYCVPLPDSSGQFTELSVTPDGKFGIQELPPGAYRVLAFRRPQPELEYRNPEAMRPYEARSQVVRLVTGQTEHLRLQLISTSE